VLNHPIDSVALLVRLGRALESQPGPFRVTQREKEITIAHAGFLEPDGLVIETQSLKLLQNIGFVTKSLDADGVMGPTASFDLTPQGQAAYERLRGDAGSPAPFSKS
jgi:hypothetical protein